MNYCWSLALSLRQYNVYEVLGRRHGLNAFEVVQRHAEASLAGSRISTQQLIPNVLEII